PDGRWRRYVNQQLKQHYPRLFARIDYLIFMRAPNVAAVHRWRQIQEDKLRARLGTTGAATRLLDGPTLARFIAHFERLTRRSLATVGDIADLTFELDDDQGVTVQLHPGQHHSDEGKRKP